MIRPLGLALLLLAAAAAAGAGPGGAYLPAFGNERIRVRAPGVRPATLFANLRFDFDGAPGDPGGTGTVTALDAEGQDVLSAFPCTWTAGRGNAFTLDPDPQGLADLLAEGIESFAGGPAVVTLETVAGKGTLRAEGTDLLVRLKAAGSVTIAGGPPRRFRASFRLG